MAERILVEITEKGAKVVQQNIAGIGASASGASTLVNNLRAALAGFIGIQTLRRAVELADTYKEIRNQIRLVTGEGEALDAVQAELAKTAKQTGTSFKTNAEFFNDLADSTQGLGLSYRDLITTQELFFKALRQGGPVTEEAISTLDRFVIGLSKGNLDALDFNRVLRQSPDLVQEIAQGLGGLSVEEFFAKFKKGGLTIQGIFEALNRRSDQINEKFGSLTKTVGESLTNLQTAAIEFFGSFDEATGFTEKIAAAIQFAADNIQTFLRVTGVLLVSFFATQLPKAIVIASGALKRFFLLFAATPVGFVLSLAAATAALVSMSSELTIVGEEVKTVGDDFVGLGAAAGQSMAGFTKAVEGVIPGLDEAIERGHFFRDIWTFALDRGIKGFVLLLAGAKVFFVSLFQLLKSVPAAFDSAFAQAYNFVIRRLNAISDAAVALPNLFGAGLESVHFEEKTFTPISELIGNAVEIGVDEGQKVIDAFNQGVAQSVAENAAKAGNAARDVLDQLNPGKKSTPIVDPEAAKKLEEEIEQLLSQVLPIRQATLDYERAQQVLNIALSQGKITATEYAQALKTLDFQTREARDPLAEVNRELDEQLRLLSLNANARERESQFMELENQLRAAGKDLLVGEAAALREKLALLQEANRLTQIEDSLYIEIMGPMESYTLGIQALNILYAQGRINQEQFTEGLNDLRISFLETQTDLASGIERTLLKLSKEYGDAASQIENVLSNAFNGLTDLFVTFTTTGKLDFKDLINQMIADLDRLFFKLLVLQPLMEAITGGGSGGSSGGILGLLGLGGGGSGSFLENLFGTGGAPQSGFTGPPTLAQSEGLFGGLFGNLFGFASGGSFEVGQQSSVATLGGWDNRVVAFRAHDGERVDVTPRGRSPRQTNITNKIELNLHGVSDYESFRKSRRQLEADMGAAIARIQARYN